LARTGGHVTSALQDFASTLRHEGVVAADAATPPDEHGDRPWFIALLQGMAGWLAGIFLLVFLGLIFKPHERGAILLLGALLLFAAWLIYRTDREAVFFDQFALALSIAGQFAVAWGVVDDDFEGLRLAATLLVLQIGIWLVMPNKTARTLAALFATIAWVYTIRFLLQPVQSGEELFGFSHGNEKVMRMGAWTVPVGWLLTWAPLLAAAGWLIHREAAWMASGLRDFARPALTGVLLGVSLGGIATEPFAFIVLGSETWGFGFSWWALFPLLSIALALFAVYGAFRIRSAGLLGFAILAALVHLSRFYYLYGTTLLWKSVIMLLAGAAFLAIGIRFQRREDSAT
jgi:hypothetical protein